ncbi:unnamed protein product [Natator depressus]
MGSGPSLSPQGPSRLGDALTSAWPGCCPGCRVADEIQYDKCKVMPKERSHLNPQPNLLSTLLQAGKPTKRPAAKGPGWRTDWRILQFHRIALWAAREPRDAGHCAVRGCSETSDENQSLPGEIALRRD